MLGDACVAPTMSERCLKFTTVDLHGGMRTSRTEFIRGRASRNESRSCTGDGDAAQYGPLRAYIHHRDLRRSFSLDLDARIYTTHRVNEYGAPVWIRGRTWERKSSGFVTQIQSETVDNGERQEMFGHVARRVISRNTTTPDSASGGHPSDTETDGWYVDPPAAWMALHPPPKPGTFYFLSARTQDSGIDEFKHSHTGPVENGFPLITTMVHRSTYLDHDGSLKVHTSTRRSEVTEFSEADLDPGLFLPPPEFRRVLQLPGELPCSAAHRLRLRWEMLRDSLLGY
jgi:hypothetical protein